jgi:hypothetical protein
MAWKSADNAFTVHPYKHTTIGSMRISTPRLATCEFHGTLYAGQRHTPSSVDFDSAQAMELVIRYFGRIPAGEGCDSTRILTERPLAASVTTTENCRRRSHRHPITYDGHPDSTR